MPALNDFLNWWDGWCENIEQAPNGKQWKRLQDRVAALRKEHQVQPTAAELAAGMVARYANGAAPKPEADVDPTPGGTHVTRRWLEQVKEKLVEAGFDGASANEVMAELGPAGSDKRFVIDLNVLPSEMAARLIA